MGKSGTKRYFSKEYKLSVVKRNINGQSSGKLSKELGLDKSLICHWARAYREVQQLYSGIESNFFIVYHLQQFRRKLGKSYVSSNLLIALTSAGKQDKANPLGQQGGPVHRNFPNSFSSLPPFGYGTVQTIGKMYLLFYDHLHVW